MGLRTEGGSARLKEINEVPWRALTKDKLGAVIFGCKHHTIAECLKKELFGLPAAHYAYVKNVTAGLTLYLFNYSDRKLHGIFEAVSCGGMNISPYAWITSEGADRTPYPAQVRIRERMKCRPLPEEEIKPIIAKNYYFENHFLFELDKVQNRRLMELFLSSTLREKMPRLEKMPHPVNTTNKNMFDCLSSPILNGITNEESKNLSVMAEMRLKENEHSSSPENSRYSLAQEMKWTDLFKPSLSSVKNEEVLESPSVRLRSSISEVCQNAANTESDSSVVECWEDIAFSDDDVKEIYENKMACLQCHDPDSGRLDRPSSENKTPLDGEGQLMLSVIDYVLAEEPGEVFINTKEKVRSVLATLGSSERDHDLVNLTPRSFQKDSNALSEGVLMGVPSSSSQNVITKLIQEVEGLKASQLNQCLKIERLEQELVLSKVEIDRLKICHNLGCKASSASDNCNIDDCSISYFTPEESVFIAGGFDGHSWLPNLCLYSPYQNHAISLCSMSFTRTYAAMAKLNTELYIFGGTFDGVWCDRVESYNPMSNQWVQRPSLKRRKGSLAGASMYDKIFAIGGGKGSECFSEVEIFDRDIGSWISIQSMIEKVCQGFYEGFASVNFVYDICVCVIHDGPYTISLMQTPNELLKMLCPLDRTSKDKMLGSEYKDRFAPAAADMNGALYVAGGYDGRDYLRSFERFDPREGAWTRLGGMNVKRGCHNLVVFKEKLYALGGYNGDSMVSSVEVFDPRNGLWMMGEAMRVSRAYLGSFVLGGKIYVIGGMQDNEVLDVMECYGENSSGWQVIGTTALGKRSSYSAVVL